MVSSVMFSSDKEDWETPRELFETLDSEFNFDVDVCASDGNTKCKKYYTKADSGLNKEWRGMCWMNPPYGKDISKWIQKASESTKTATTVCLVPARTDTRWFHDFCYGKAEIRFLKGRVKFSGSKNSAPFPSMLVIFKAMGR